MRTYIWGQDCQPTAGLDLEGGWGEGGGGGGGGGGEVKPSLNKLTPAPSKKWISKSFCHHVQGPFSKRCLVNFRSDFTSVVPKPV